MKYKLKNKKKNIYIKFRKKHINMLIKMLTREKTFTIRGSSAKSSRIISLFRPNSGKSRTQYSSIRISSNISDNIPPPIFTMPNNRKLTNGMGNKIEREQLYENNMQLRENLNKLERQLKKSKYLNVKTEMELRKKEKLIENLINENSKDEIDQKRIIPVKESVLLTKFKQKYNKIKTDYEKLNSEYNILKANKKLTSIREYQIENEVLNKEIKKIKSLYENSKKYYDKYKDTNEKFKEIKIKFVEQHSIILSYEQKIEMLNEKIKILEEENINIKKDIENERKRFEKYNIKNKILEIKNKKLLDNKKIKEISELEQNNYKKDNEEQKKEIFELKSALNIRISEIQTLQKECDNYKKLIEKIDNTSLEPINYQNFQHFEKKEYPKNADKLELYKSLYEESLIIISSYEKYFKENDINPKNIVKNYGYNGTINSNNKIIYNFNDKIEEKNYLDNNTDAGLSNTNTKVFSNELQNENEIQSDINNEMKEKENFYFLIFIKNLEAKKITSEYMKNKIESIKKLFNDKKSIKKEEFLSPFIKMLIEDMKITKEEDKKQIENFMSEYFDYFQNNYNIFIQQLIEIFDNIINYDSKNTENYLNSLAFNIQKYKNELIQKLKEIDKKNTKIISFQDFYNLISEIKMNINKNLLNFLLFKMKENMNKSYSMFDLNYNIILELLEQKLPDNFEDNIIDDESLDYNNIISEKLSEFKNNMDKNGVNLEEICKNKVQTLLANNKNIEVIEKNDFFKIMEKYNISLDEQIKDIIYKCFISNEFEDNNKNKDISMMDFSKLKDLFLNNYYENNN